MAIASHLRSQSTNILILTGSPIAGALLHDIAKTLCIKTGCQHARVGQQILEDLGFPELGQLVGEHVVLINQNYENNALGIFTATEIVNYADKRVRHDQVVPLTGAMGRQFQSGVSDT